MKAIKSIITILFLIILPVVANAQDLVQKANAAYDKDKYSQALELYLKAEKQDGTSSELYYNIGNSYYKLGNMGRAILYYERALNLDPSNEDGKTNLDFVNDKIQSKTDNGSTFISDWIDSAISSHSSNGWAAIAAVLFVGFIITIIIYVFASNVMLRKFGFFGGGLLLLVCLFALICSFHMKSKLDARNEAIVVVPSATLSTSPRLPQDKTEEAFLLTEGNKVTIVDSVQNKSGMTMEKWYDVKADDTHRAWIKSSDIEII